MRMEAQDNPYLCPNSQEEMPNKAFQPDLWTTPRLVFLFFTPALFLLSLAAILHLLKTLHLNASATWVNLAILPVVGLFALSIAIFSASIHMRRQGAGVGILILFSLIYLIAEVFSLLLTLKALAVFLVR